MAGKRYWWFKMPEDFFQSKRIKRLRTLAGGDTYTIIYLKLQLKALRDDGYLYHDKVVDDFIEELALDIDENPEDVKVTVHYLISVGLVEVSEDGEVYKLPYLLQLIGSESDSAERMRKSRDKKRLESSQCDTNVQICCTEIEKEKELDQESEREQKKEKKQENTWFDDFWEAYPKKTKKPQGRKAFDKACKDEDTFEAIMDGLEMWKTYWEGIDQQFIQYPASWLNGEQWNDDPPQSKTASGGHKIDCPDYMKMDNVLGINKDDLPF